MDDVIKKKVAVVVHAFSLLLDAVVVLAFVVGFGRWGIETVGRGADGSSSGRRRL